MGMGRGERRELLFVRAVLLEQIFFFHFNRQDGFYYRERRSAFFFARNS